MVIASTDGFCTLIHFNATELGIPLSTDQQKIKITVKGEVEPEETKKPKKNKNTTEDVEIENKVRSSANSLDRMALHIQNGSSSDLEE